MKYIHRVSHPLQPPHFPNEQHKPNTTRSVFLPSCSLIPFYSLQAARLFSPPFFAIVLNWYNQCLIGSFALVDCWRYHTILYYTYCSICLSSLDLNFYSSCRNKPDFSIEEWTILHRISCRAALPYTVSCPFYPSFQLGGSIQLNSSGGYMLAVYP